MSDTPTPRTDAEAACPWDVHDTSVVPLDKAREIERELVATQERLSASVTECARINSVACRYAADFAAALDLLHAMATQHWCGCGHPHCNRCADDRDNAELLRRHGRNGPWEDKP